MTTFQTTRIGFQPTYNEDTSEGIWRTTDGGAKIFIKDGEVRAGGPKGPVLGKGEGGEENNNDKSLPKLSRTEALDLYSGTDRIYAEVNNYLRGTQKELSERGEQLLEGMDRVFKETETTDSTLKVYRGVDSDLLRRLGAVPEHYEGEWWTYANPEMDVSGLKGKVIEDKGFMSTSTRKSEAEKYNAQTQLQISVPKGTSMVDSGFRYDEGEVLFNRGSKLQITGVKVKVDEDGDWQAIINAKMVSKYDGPTVNMEYRHPQVSFQPTSNNCGVGSKGFQPGNTCAKGGGDAPDLAGGLRQFEVIEKASKELSGKWNPNPAALKKLAQAEGIDTAEDKLKEAVVYHSLRSWQGSSGSPSHLEVVRGAVQKSGIETKDIQQNKGPQGWFDKNPDVREALNDLGGLMYDQTQDYLKENNIESLELHRKGNLDQTFSSWASQKAGVRHEGSGEVHSLRIPRERIMSVPLTGFGSRDEYEVVVLGSNLTANNCGIGPGGFQPGNTCAKGGGGVAGAGSEVPKGFKAANPDASDSLTRYTNLDGSLTPERQKLHDKIVKEVLDKATPVNNPVFHMMGGGPASGKSVALNSGMVNIDPNSITVDSDDIKHSLPEYASMVGAKNPRSAAFAHEESSMLAKRITSEALAQSKNVVLDGTGDNTVESVAKKVEEARKYGVRVEATYVTVATETAIARNLARAEKTGRLVPSIFVEKAHVAVSKIVPHAIEKGLFDGIRVLDTNISGQVRLVAIGSGTMLKVEDEQLWENFLAKAAK
jgi:predicted ABC-type ATPase